MNRTARIVGTAAVALSLVGLGCGGDDIVSISIGELVVTTTTSGIDLDPNGYDVQVEGSAFNTTESIGISETIRFSLIADRTYTVTLSGVAANCGPEANPQVLTVVPDLAVTALFNVGCGPGA